MKKYSSNQSGRSMIEMLGVLAIVGVLSVAGIAGYSKAMAKYKTNKLIDQVSTVAANVRTTFAGQGNYKGLDDKSAYQLGVLTEDVAKDCDVNGYSDGCAHNVFGGFFGVLLMDDSRFGIFVKDLPRDACVALVTADWGPASTFAGIEGVGGKGCDNGTCPPAVLKSSAMSMIDKLCHGTESNDNYAYIIFK